MRTTTRLIVCGALLAALQIGATWLRQGYFPETVAIPEPGLESLASQIGEWAGEDVPTDPRVVTSLGAQATVDRRYIGPTGEVVYMHVALWTDEFESVPHPPQLCYSNAGWRIAESRGVSLPGTGPETARMLTLEQSGASAHALYWYQLDKVSFVDRDGLRSARRALWGRPEWPPVMKVLLHQSDAGGTQDGEGAKRFASALAPYLNELQ